MIPVLLKANAVDFSTYGIGVLADCISCEVTEERNGAYELVLQYPVTGRNYGELSSERIIKAKPNDTADDQAFRIYRITTPIDGVVAIYFCTNLIGWPITREYKRTFRDTFYRDGVVLCRLTYTEHAL